MSLKRKGKIQYSFSPKSLIQKQINQDFIVCSNVQSQNSLSYQQQLIHKMEQKIHKILAAYQRLQHQNKNKDLIIKQLEKQNLLLKQRLISKKNQSKNSKISNLQILARKQPIQGHIIQRTFTPFNFIQPNQKRSIESQAFKKNQQEKFDGKNFKYYNPTSSIVQQYSSKQIQNKAKSLLRQSKSLQNLNKTAPYKTYVGNKQLLNNQSYRLADQSCKMFTKRDQNRLNVIHAQEQDKSFLDVLGKLKEKIKRFDQQDVENTNLDLNFEQKDTQRNTSLKLSKVKSTHNIRKPFNFNESHGLSKQNGKKQMRALKQIWNQRDEEIKRMDQLFKNIDQRLSFNNN